MPSIILFGATGLIGVPLSKQLKEDHPSWPLTVYVRNESEAVAGYFKSVGVDRIVYGSFDDRARVSELSKTHDIVVNAGVSHDGAFANAILDGQKQRPGDSKGKLVHISGTGNFLDRDANGAFNPDGKVWNDDKEEDIRLINTEMFNGASDRPILDAGNEGKVDTYIACLAIVYGRVDDGPSPSLGVGYNILTSMAKPLGFVPYVGDGTAVAATVHVLDGVQFVADLVTHAAAATADAHQQGSAESRYYIVSGGQVAWRDLASELAGVLHRAGAVASPEPRSVSPEQAFLPARNMLVRGDRAARMCFRPRQPSILESVRRDLEGRL
ncbi:hypothetical protein GGR56DRAFT_681511 [Xylariaceae sp. FL0804]|nr:hypothetical protein GGR56DRAFT_681511 [Xylariaceae sp. FL0804]